MFSGSKTSNHRAQPKTYCGSCCTWQVATWNHRQSVRHIANDAPHRALLIAARVQSRSVRDAQLLPSEEPEPTMPAKSTTKKQAAVVEPVAVKPVAAPAAVVEPVAVKPVAVDPVADFHGLELPAEPAASVAEPAAAADPLMWLDDFKTLIIDMPPSVVKQIEVRLAKSKLSPTGPMPEEVDAAIIKAAIVKACSAYTLKREKARLASAARRLAKKAPPAPLAAEPIAAS